MLPDIPHSINVSFDPLFDKHIFLLPDGHFLSLFRDAIMMCYRKNHILEINLNTLFM